jgi:hypothetical protein
MLIVVTILSLLIGISFPALSSGMESLRLVSGADDFAATLNGALNRAERRRHAVEIAIAPAENALLAASFDSGFRRRISLPPGVRIVSVLPALHGDNSHPRRFFFFPGGAPPRLGILLANGRGDQRMVRLDPVSSVALVERVEAR